MPTKPRGAGPRLDVLKTYKLYINGQFPRTESGRSWPVAGAKGSVVAHLCLASRKDLREAVEAARAAQPRWAGASAYNRGQVLYRVAEMMEGKRDELAGAIAAVGPAGRRAARGVLTPRAEVAAAIDLAVHYAGWADKYAQVLGCHNPAAGPYYNFTVPEPTGVVGVIAPDASALLGLLALLLPVVMTGNAAVALASNHNPIPSMVLAEVLATSDVPAGVVNILTGKREELLPHVATHRDIDAVHAACDDQRESALLREGAAENLKRVVVRDAGTSRLARGPAGPADFSPFVEFKTIWHPSAV